jgi:hypothetical protein
MINAEQRRRRQENPDHHRALDRARHQRDRDKRNAASRRYRLAHQEELRAYDRRWRREQKRKALTTYSSAGEPMCAHCGTTEYRTLGLLAVDPRLKKPSTLWNCKWYYSLERAGYPDGCIVICQECRRARH